MPFRQKPVRTTRLRPSALLIFSATTGLVGGAGTSEESPGRSPVDSGVDARICDPGNTRTCVGAAACRGGQSCDSSGHWSACACGAGGAGAGSSGGASPGGSGGADAGTPGGGTEQADGGVGADHDGGSPDASEGGSSATVLRILRLTAGERDVYAHPDELAAVRA